MSLLLARIFSVVTAANNGSNNMERNTVLVVEDDKDIRESLQLLFEEEGYAVVTADDGREALDRIPSLPKPTVILLDFHMPRLDGYNVVRDLASHPQQRDDHAIFLLTADVRQLSPEMGQLLGSEGVPVLPKPFDVEKLLAQVHSAFLRLEEQRES
jgi:two-component system, OmpR family, response regulator MprA